MQSDVYAALDVLEPGSFDLVFTGSRRPLLAARHPGLGAIVAGLLRPGGRLFLREGHPILWSLSDDPDRTACWPSNTPTSSDPSRSVFEEEGSYVNHGGAHRQHPQLLLQPRSGRDRDRAPGSGDAS